MQDITSSHKTQIFNSLELHPKAVNTTHNGRFVLYFYECQVSTKQNLFFLIQINLHFLFIYSVVL